MYGVLSTTPPQSPAASVHRPSVARIARVSYSSPAAAALSVLSIPPTIVATAKGNAIGRYPQASERPARKVRLGQGKEAVRLLPAGRRVAAGAVVTPAATRTYESATA